MSTRSTDRQSRRILISSVAALGLVLFAICVALTNEPVVATAQVEGQVFRLHKVSFGTEHSFTSGSPWQQCIHKLAPHSWLDEVQESNLGTNRSAIVCWLESPEEGPQRDWELQDDRQRPFPANDKVSYLNDTRSPVYPVVFESYPMQVRLTLVGRSGDGAPEVRIPLATLGSEPCGSPEPQ